MPSIDAVTAVALATALRSVSSALRDTHVRRLKSQLGAPGSAGRSLDKSGTEIQAEAMQGVQPLAGNSCACPPKKRKDVR